MIAAQGQPAANSITRDTLGPECGSTRLLWLPEFVPMIEVQRHLQIIQGGMGVAISG